MNDVEKSYRQMIGKKIKLARARNNYTQEALAEKLQLSTRYISQLERGIAFGSATTLVNLCNALEINTNFLFEEVINNNFTDTSKALDENFFNNYMQLNFYHRKIVNTLVDDLLKLQASTSSKNDINKITK